MVSPMTVRCSEGGDEDEDESCTDGRVGAK